MGNRRRKVFRAARPISLAVQNLQVRRLFPGFSYRYCRSAAHWSGTLQPRLTSPVYTIEISYRLFRIPIVKVLHPVLAPKPPHVYPDGSLCLYWPREWRWTTQCLIAETIIPWTASWLYFYELWLDTEKWLGPSAHDSPSK